jgi:hypothetical protein
MSYCQDCKNLRPCPCDQDMPRAIEELERRRAGEKSDPKVAGKTISEILGEIKARADSATPGPWTLEEGYYDFRVAETLRHNIYGPEKVDWDHEVENGPFIAHAREDVPRLVEALEKANERLEFIARGYTMFDAVNKGLRLYRQEIAEDTVKEILAILAGEKE